MLEFMVEAEPVAYLTGSMRSGSIVVTTCYEYLIENHSKPTYWQIDVDGIIRLIGRAGFNAWRSRLITQACPFCRGRSHVH